MKQHQKLQFKPDFPVTPFLALDQGKFRANVDRLKNRLAKYKVQLRPHLKTVKSIEAAGYLLESGQQPVAVSTLREAEYFSRVGYENFLYAVGIVPKKLGRVVELRKNNINVSILLDTVEQAEEVARVCQTENEEIPVFIEIDCDGHRGGLAPDDARLTRTGKILEAGGAKVQGVLTHAGESYNCRSPESLKAAAENECLTAVQAASKLREAGLECPVVSVGSTPTAFSGESYDGVTEVRAGVFAFFDLVMAEIGVCQVEDIAISVVTTVIGCNENRGWLIVDAGWMALSSDPGTSASRNDTTYGLVCDAEGNCIDGFFVKGLNQEHGILATRNDAQDLISKFPLGTRLRILPNHACATASQHDSYTLLSRDGTKVQGSWQRLRGW